LTAAHQALRTGHMDLARFLIQHVPNEDGSTLLHVVSYRGHVDLARFLVEHGADTTAHEKHG
jgi:ankyrin repeat protein